MKAALAEPVAHPRVGDLIVKGFQVPARNQEMILAAFEEECWPSCIFDPLPPYQSIVPSRRLHNAVNRLNGSPTHPLIRFSGNGNGTGVCWEFRLPQSEAVPIVSPAGPPDATEPAD